MRKSLAFAAVLALAFAGAAVAQMSGAGSPATQAYVDAMRKMDDAMKTMKPTGDPSMDFVMMMAPHHQAAVDMAQAYLKYGKDPEITRMAKKILSGQSAEISQMRAWEKKHGM